MNAVQDLSVVREVRRFVEGRRDMVVELCADLVAAASENPPGDTRAAVTVIDRFLRRAGIETERVAEDERMPNLVAQLEGGAPGRHLVLNGHADTIRAGREEDWTVPVRSLTNRDGRLYGLGIGNMKGALAAMCLALLLLSERRDRWNGRVSLTIVSDEVVLGEKGAAALLSRRADLSGDAMLSGEGPGGMGLAVAEKGVAWFEVTVVGPPRQSMLVEGADTPVARLAEAILEVDRLNGRASTLPPTLAGIEADAESLRISANVGLVQAGVVPNQVAERATAWVDVRVPPGLDVSHVHAGLKRALKRIPGLTLARAKGWDPSWTPPEHPFVRAVAAAAEAVRGTPPHLVVRLPASDASRWRRAGTPAVCYGPQPTAVAGVDDYVTERDLLDCAAVYALVGMGFGEGLAHE
jgi:succinyl-diaminopimelate desuccinylase